MKWTFFLFSTIFTLNLGFTQTTYSWTGNNDGSTWEDAGNWDVVAGSGTTYPGDGTINDLALFDQVNFVGGSNDVLISGGDISIAQIVYQKTGSSNPRLRLNMNLDIDASALSSSAILLNSGGKLTLVDGEYNFTSDAASPTLDINKQFDLTVLSNSTLNLLGGGESIILNNGNADVLIQGLLSISNGYGDGIDFLDGTFTNEGSMTVGTTLDGDGIFVEENMEFVNNGTLNVTQSDTGTSNRAIDVKGIFTNNIDGVLEVTGAGPLTDNLNRGIALSSNGVFNNFGTVNTENGGNPAGQMIAVFNSGTYNNKACARTNLSDSRMFLFNESVLVNEGFITSTFPNGVGVIGGGTSSATNKAFYSYSVGSNNLFASGSSPNKVDDGLDVDFASNLIVDANSSCSANIGIVEPYTWEDENINIVGQNHGTGEIVFTEEVFDNPGTQMISPSCYAELVFTINNIDGDCVSEQPLEVACPANENLPCNGIAPDAISTLDEFVAAGGVVSGGSETTYTITSVDVTTGSACEGFTITRTYTVTDDENSESITCDQVFNIAPIPLPMVDVLPGETITCLEDIIAAESDLTISGACQPTTSIDISLQSTIGEEGCPGSTYIYAYSVNNGCGTPVVVTRTFSLENSFPLTINVVPNLTVDCFEGINPNPVFAQVDNGCDNPAIDISISGPVPAFDSNCPNTSYTFTYTATDACGRIASANQVYTIQNDGPAIECPDNCEVFGCYDGDYEAIIDAWLNTVTATSSCSDQLNVSNSYNGVNGICINNGFTPVTFSTTDECGRTATCSSQIIMIDTDAPEIIGTPQEMLVPCTANTADIFADWIATQGGVESFDACWSNVSWSYSASEQLDCSNGPQAIIVIFTATDGCGNAASVNGVFSTKVLPNMVQVEGIIQTENAEPVADVQVTMNNTTSGSPIVDMSTNDGTYVFPELETVESMSVEPQKNDDLLNGLSTYDLILLQQHILQIESLDSPYKKIAADVNRSGTVSTLDLVLLRRLILHIDEELIDNTSWRFIDADYVFPNPDNPFESEFPESYQVGGEAEEYADFVAVKIGDLNLDAEPNAFGQLTEDRSLEESLKLLIEEQELKAGEVYNISLQTIEHRSLLGLQFTLDYDYSLISISEITAQSLTDFNSNNFNLIAENGQALISWNHPAGLEHSFQDEDSGMAKPGGSELMRIKIKALEDTDLSEVLSISSSMLKGEAYQNNQLMGLELEFIPPVDSYSGIFELQQNIPNPFSSSTLISFEIPKNESVTLNIFDTTGKLIYSDNGFFTAGFNQFEVTADLLSGKGIYYYQVSTSNGQATEKMILIN